MIHLKEFQLSDPVKCQKIRNTLNGLTLSDATVERVRAVFQSEMQLALNMKPSSLQMENTYIPELLDGTEDGVYLAMDLGGTHLRVLLVTLSRGEVVNELVQHFDIPDALRIGCGEALLDHLAKCLDTFAVQQGLRDDVRYPLGFTFSFPMRQQGLDSGRLVTWTKSFNCPSLVGEDVVEKLRESLLRCKRTNIEILAILNDTTGTLMHGSLLDKRTRVGVVLGTGTNGCYMESADRVLHWQQQRHGEQHVIIDVEWGAFGDNGTLDFMKTDFDRLVDDGSLLRNSFTFEKYIGGKYLGELCRVILQRLHVEGLFLDKLPEENFPKAWTFGSNNVSAIEQDTLHNGSEKTQSILQTVFQCERFGCTYDDLIVLRQVCGLISLRAAQLVAITISTILNRMHDEQQEITVAIDGSVYKHHPRLKQWIGELTQQWTSHKNVSFLLAEDGSGKGAALVAAIAMKLKEKGKMENKS